MAAAVCIHPGKGSESRSSNREAVVRCRLEVRGRVQGVGFRPFVYRLASDMELGGFVGNDAHGVFIELEGPPTVVAAFNWRLRAEIPPAASITHVTAHRITPVGDDRHFRILASDTDGRPDAEIAPDLPVCEDCLRELFDPADRRYRYPFINCTNCGPRYSIIRAVPYDRPNTTMSAFTMCEACALEYADPRDRRFHAQPNACPACGPRVQLVDARGAALQGDAIKRCVDLLRSGAIVAIKGIGGFHLSCCARDDAAVARLRERKGREAKPLALMVAGLEEARRLVLIDDAAGRVLVEPARPIVLLPKRRGHRVSTLVAPGSADFGVMLPYTPLHHLLFAERIGPLVMTSANPSEEPLCRDNDEALLRLGGVADAFLLHDRDIERRVDDSVVRAGGAVDGPRVTDSLRRDAARQGGQSSVLPITLRRARGYAPAAMELPVEAEVPILATGAEMKSAVCLMQGGRAVLSEHLGELSNPVTWRHFIETIDAFKRLLDIDPQMAACDLHPAYAATRFARGLGLPLVEVQHHHAHAVSLMAEHGLSGPVVAVVCDGTGYGTDGAIWGGEVLVCDETGFERAAHLRYFPLPGGDAAAQETWRPLAGLLRTMFGPRWRERWVALLAATTPGRTPAPRDHALVASAPRGRRAPAEHRGHIPATSAPRGRRAPARHRHRARPDTCGGPRWDAETLAVAEQRMVNLARVPRTSSTGRMFDAVAALIGACDRNRFEAEAAMTLEAMASEHPQVEPLRYRIDGRRRRPRPQSGPAGAFGTTAPVPRSTGPMQLDLRPMMFELLDDLAAGRPAREMARAFHETLAAMFAEAADITCRDTGLNRVALSGGCFANRLLTERLVQRLQDAGREVFVHRRIPPGDGGIALGQAMVAAARHGRRH